jgi:transposase
LRQIVCGISVTADGMLPLLGESHDGNQAETPTVLPHLKKLQQELMALFGVEKLFVLGDSKLVSVETAQGMKQAGIDFLAPSTRSGNWERRLQAALRARRRGQWQELSYQSVRAQLAAHVKQPRQDHPGTTYEGYESLMVLSNGRQSVRLREIFIYDSALAGQQRALRQHHLERVKELLEELRPRLGKWTYRSREAIERKVEQILARHPSVREFLSIVVRERQGRFELVVRERTGRLREAAEQDGIYSLLTAAGPERLTLEQALRADREQTCIERRLAEFKGPLRVRPVFVRTPERIVALVGLTLIELLLWATVERQCRRGQEQEQGPTLKPITAKQIWRRFKHLGAQRVRVWLQGEVILWLALDPLPPAQAEVLGWLGITAAELRAPVQDSS